MNHKNSVEIQEFPLWAKMEERKSLFSFTLEITARCNNDCRHCYINLPPGDQHARSRELTLEEINELADQAVELGALWVLISGGEPLLREDFPEIYLLLKRKGLFVSVFTNATLVNEEHIALFRKYPPRDIEVTVYGATAESYERVTQKPGSFAAFTKGLDLLFENGVNVRLKAVVMRSNFKELPVIAEFCRARTKDYFRFDPQLHMRFDRNEERNMLIRSERLTPEEIVALDRADGERFSSLQKECQTLIDSAVGHVGCDHLFHCALGQGECTISYDGTFRLCSSLWAPGTVYDLREGSLRHAWEEFVPKVLDMRSRRPEYQENCHNCTLIDFCLWCPAHAHLETGELDVPIEYFCRVAHARAEAIQS